MNPRTNVALYFCAACVLLFLTPISALSQDSFLTRQSIVQDLLGKNQGSVAAPVSFDQETQPRGEKKSPALAALYSLLLPGMGELYVGDYGTGKYFTIAEGALWVGWGGMQWYGNWQKNDAHQFAAQHAQVTPDGKEDQYFIDIGNFKNVYTYNEAVLRGRDAFSVYNPQSSFYWQWDTDVNRETYRQLRVSSEETFNNAKFVIAAIGVNHLISAINAGRLAISHNHSVEEASTIDVHAGVLGSIAQPQGFVISVSKSF
ncbi:MAG TPA: hypothetical protein VL633_13200 [Bacteroidota bacterium]|jgi:hypothetical protein|nr:hypothetical protein [Bacteroidota bacterium]